MSDYQTWKKLRILIEFDICRKKSDFIRKKIIFYEFDMINNILKSIVFDNGNFSKKRILQYCLIQERRKF